MPDKLTLDHWQLLFADSHIEFETAGEIAASTMAYLTQELQQDTKPALLFTHHPPIHIDSEWMDKIGMKNGLDLLTALVAFPQLRAVVFGHIHQQWHSRHQHLQLLGTPSTCVQFAPLSQQFAIDNTHPGYRLFTLHDDGHFETEVKRCSMQLRKIISGGQTGVDRAALDTAIKLAIPHGGWCPLGRRAEDGKLAATYQLTETPTANYAQRTEWNVRDSDATLIITEGSPSGGTALTCELAQRMGRPLFILDLQQLPDPEALLEWLHSNQIRQLNIAGPRESGLPGIYLKVSNFLVQVLSYWLEKEPALNQTQC